jgi:hypothetical protein
MMRLSPLLRLLCFPLSQLKSFKAKESWKRGVVPQGPAVKGFRHQQVVDLFGEDNAAAMLEPRIQNSREGGESG